MRILFLSDNFPPEVNAPANRTFEHCREWVKSGVEVTVITCAPNFPQGKVYEGYSNRLYQVNWYEGVRVIRVWSYIAPNKGFLRRILDYLSFFLTGTIAGLFQKGDVIVATSPQLFSALAGFILGSLKGIPWVFEVRDIWPESITAVGAMKKSFAIRALERLEMFLYRACSKIVVVSPAFKDRLASRGVDPSKIVTVENGVDSLTFYPRPKKSVLIKNLNLEGKKIVGYIGTHGMAHKLDFILRCADYLRDNKTLHFLLMGDGAGKQSLIELARSLNLSNVTLLDPVSHDEISSYLSILDISLVNLKRSDTFLSVIPSKIFESAAMGIPILLGVDGQARKLVEEFQAGVFFTPEDQGSFCEALEKLLTDQNLFKNATVGCAKLAKHYSRSRLASEMLSELRNLCNDSDTRDAVLPSQKVGGANL